MEDMVVIFIIITWSQVSQFWIYAVHWLFHKFDASGIMGRLASLKNLTEALSV